MDQNREQKTAIEKFMEKPTLADIQGFVMAVKNLEQVLEIIKESNMSDQSKNQIAFKTCIAYLKETKFGQALVKQKMENK